MQIELDGEPWRTVPLDIVADAGLHVGARLDRERLRVVRRELRSREALAKASRLVANRELSERRLGEELARRKVAPAVRRQTVARLVEAGAVNDRRLAFRRAEELAERGGGDALIRADLEARGVAAELIRAAIGALAGEEERARRVVERRGRGPATARYLARKGFAEEAVGTASDGSIAGPDPGALG